MVRTRNAGRSRDVLIRRSLAFAEMLRRDAPITRDTVALALDMTPQQAARWVRVYRAIRREHLRVAA